MTRVPAFEMRNPSEVPILGEWIKGNQHRIQTEVVDKHSSHAFLTDIIWMQDMDVRTK